jgi:hypothetical protein
MKHLCLLFVTASLILSTVAFGQMSTVYVDYPANALWKATTNSYTNWQALDYDHSSWLAAQQISSMESPQRIIAQNSGSVNTAYFRGELNFTYEYLNPVSRVLIFAEANTSFDLYFNGSYCGGDSSINNGPLRAFNVTNKFSTTKNVVAIKAWVNASTQPSVYCLVRIDYIISPVIVSVLRPPEEIPNVPSLSQNYPNPFNPATTFEYTINHRDNVLIEVYNDLGQRVATLLNAVVEPGNHKLTWNGRNSTQTTVATGTYFYRLTVNGNVQTKKMVIIK